MSANSCFHYICQYLKALAEYGHLAWEIRFIICISTNKQKFHNYERKHN